MELDLRTIAVLSTALSVLTFITLAALMSDFPRESREELRYWTLGIGLLATGWRLIAARGHVPDVASVVMGNLALFLGFQSFLFALRAFLRLPVLRWRDAPMPLLQVVQGAILIAAVLGESARVLWVHAPRPQPMAYHVVGVSLVAAMAILRLPADDQRAPAARTASPGHRRPAHRPGQPARTAARRRPGDACGEGRRPQLRGGRRLSHAPVRDGAPGPPRTMRG